MKYNGIVEAKMRVIEQNLADIESWNITSFAQFKDSSLFQSAVERNLQVCFELMIDISERILALEGKPPTNTASENITELQKLGVISKKTEYSDMIRFRNFIVHR